MDSGLTEASSRAREGVQYILKNQQGTFAPVAGRASKLHTTTGVLALVRTGNPATRARLDKAAEFLRASACRRRTES